MKKRICSKRISAKKAVVSSAIVFALGVCVGLYTNGRHGDSFSECIKMIRENHVLDGREHNKSKTKDQALKRLCSQTERLRILEETCARRNITHVKEAPFKQIKRLLVDDRHKLIYCGAEKAGSSAWLRTLVEASGKPLHKRRVVVHSYEVLGEYGLRRMNYYSEREIKQRLKTYFKFIVVRHPFERVVSAWFDKFIMPDGPYTNLSRTIADKYKIDRSGFQNSTNATYWNTRALFIEFAMHLFETHKKDQHWMNFDEACNPCAVKWDAVLKVESMNHDSALVFKRFGNDINLTSLPVRHSNQDHATLNHFEKKLDEFSGIRNDALGYLHDKYDHDLAMFGYSWNQDKLLAKCGQTDSDTVCC